MLNWLLATPPKLGSRWKKCYNRNPFSKYIIVVVNIKQGWVRFRDHNYLYDEASIRDFRYDYREII